MQRFEGRVAVITGGAKGIGYALAEAFAAEGMKIVIADIDQADLDDARTKLEAKGVEVLAVRTDVGIADQVKALADATIDRFGAVHVLCNNAGVGGFQRFNTTSLTTWKWQMDVNIWGPIYGCHYFLPLLALQDEAHIVNTASMAGFTYAAFNHPYNVTKAGVVALSEGLFQECAVDMPNVGVSVLCPVWTATTIHTQDEKNAPAGHVPRTRADTHPMLEQIRSYIADNMSPDKAKTPAEVANYVIEGIRQRKLHIFTHPEWLVQVEQRMTQIIEGRNPPNLIELQDQMAAD